MGSCFVWFEVLTAVSTKMAVFRVVPWWWRQQGPLKRWQTSTTLHGATTQKTAIFTCIICACTIKTNITEELYTLLMYGAQRIIVASVEHVLSTLDGASRFRELHYLHQTSNKFHFQHDIPFVVSGCGRKRCRGLIWGMIAAFAWKDWRKPLKPSVRTAGLRSDFWNAGSRSANHSAATFGTCVKKKFTNRQALKKQYH
jgi:hypothetical protein